MATALPNNWREYQPVRPEPQRRGFLDLLVGSPSPVEYRHPTSGDTISAPVSEGGVGGWASGVLTAGRQLLSRLPSSGAGQALSRVASSPAAARGQNVISRAMASPAGQFAARRPDVAGIVGAGVLGLGATAATRGGSEAPGAPAFTGSIPANATVGTRQQGFGQLTAGIGREAGATLNRQLQNLDARFDAQRQQLTAMFQLAETPEEQARLAFVLGDLEAQREAGQQIIASQYAQAQQYASSQAGQMRDAAQAEAAAMQGLYRDAAQGAASGIAGIAGDYTGTGLGVGAVPVSGDATDWIGLIEAQGASQGALTGRLGGIAADDQAWLASQLGAEGSAQQGDLIRTALGMRADTIARHQQAVSDRVNAERAAMQRALMDLESMRFGRQFDLEDQQVGMQAQRGRDELMWTLAREEDRLGQLTAGAPAGSVPSDPIEQIAWLGQLFASGDKAAAAAVTEALVSQGVIAPEIADGFLALATIR